jgi:hypothetical protein
VHHRWLVWHRDVKHHYMVLLSNWDVVFYAGSIPSWHLWRQGRCLRQPPPAAQLLSSGLLRNSTIRSRYIHKYYQLNRI